MPASPAQIDRLIRPVVHAYLNAEATILTLLARQLAAGIDAPDWPTRSQSGAVRRQADQILGRLTREAARRIGEAIRAAYELGAAPRAGAQPRTSQDSPVPVPVPDLPDTRRRVLTWADQVYRQTIDEATNPVLTGDRTRRQTAQAALDRLTDRGVTGFVDQAGRGWDLASYVEMATRPATGQAALAGQVDRLRAQGIDLAVVSNAPAECATCRQWEGSVLTLTGAAAGVVRAPSVRTGQPVTVRVAGSLAQARAAGLFHPNCRHSLSAYLPGLTTTPQDTADPAGDQARQQLRHLERQVRRWRRREAAALDPTTAARARQHVRVYQDRIREHTAAAPVRRQRHRERLNIAR